MDHDLSKPVFGLRIDLSLVHQIALVVMYSSTCDGPTSLPLSGSLSQPVPREHSSLRLLSGSALSTGDAETRDESWRRTGWQINWDAGFRFGTLTQRDVCQALLASSTQRSRRLKATRERLDNNVPAPDPRLSQRSNRTPHGQSLVDNTAHRSRAA